MDVLRRVKALRRRPEKVWEDFEALQLQSPNLYDPSSNHQQQLLNLLAMDGRAKAAEKAPIKAFDDHYAKNQHHLNLLSYEDLRSLSSMEFDLRLSMLQSGSGSETPGSRIKLLPKWPKQMGVPKVSVGVPKINLKSSISDMRLRKKSTNEVFRSNSFRFERYERDGEGPNAPPHSQASQLNKQKVGPAKSYSTPSFWIRFLQNCFQEKPSPIQAISSGCGEFDGHKWPPKPEIQMNGTLMHFFEQILKQLSW